MRYTPSGMAVARFTLATNENRKDQQGNWQSETTWHTIVVFGQAAERASESFKKGNLAYVEGRISMRNWEDKEGQKRTSFEILANTIRNLSPKEGGESIGESSHSQPEPTHFGSGPDEDLPF
ncbi:single-stranded DNA-binding protein [bacterium]|nr:single-stranded DNA-binding protein [bacterium]